MYKRQGGDFKFGERLANPRLGKTMREIAARGRDGFYKGWVAEDMVSKLNALGGVHTQADFDNAVAEYVEPIKTNFRGYDIWECPPNGQGIIALMLLNVASKIDKFGDHPLSLERMHHEIEAGKLAYRDRGLYVGDTEFNEVSMEAMLSQEHAEAIRCCLLYTSPSPRDCKTSRMPSSA